MNKIFILLVGLIIGLIAGEYKACDGSYNWDSGVCK